jgi:hypothetical protein
MIWRWDQGRLKYFQASTIRKSAKVLAQFDGQLIQKPAADILRKPLQNATELMYPPAKNPHYPIWRNFGRVIEQQLLATRIAKRLVVTDLCKNLADDANSISDEQYMQFLVSRYAIPSPSFQGYDSTLAPKFPFCAVIKLALSRLKSGGNPVTSKDVVQYLIGNDATGKERLSFYERLEPSTLKLSAKRERQVREMIAILGQIPFLKWENYALSVDASEFTSELEEEIFKYATPDSRLPRKNKEEEVLNLGSLDKRIIPPVQITVVREEDWNFVEGSRRRVTHLRIERSSKLRAIYIARTKNPSFCDMCSMDTFKKYPWSKNLIEVHHLLPLGSLLRVELKSTSLKDVVGICPTCHKATHQFYRRWLSHNGVEDFRSPEEAYSVYAAAKQSVVN